MHKAESFIFSPDISKWHASVLLAQVAAPFIAGGASIDDAIRRSVDLTAECLWALYSYSDSSVIISEKGVTLDEFLPLLGMKSPRSVKKYIFTVIPNATEAKLLWKYALAGKPVLTPSLRNKIKSHQASLFVKRNKKVVASRTAKMAVK